MSLFYKKKAYLELEDDYSPGGLSTRVSAGPNNAYETTKDLAKIAESHRASSPKKFRRKVNKMIGSYTGRKKEPFKEPLGANIVVFLE